MEKICTKRSHFYTFCCKVSLSGSGAPQVKRVKLIFMCTDMINGEMKGGEGRAYERKGLTSPSSRPASFHHLQNSEGMNEIKPFFLFPHWLSICWFPSRFLPEFYRGLGGNILRQGGFCAGLTVDAEDLCNNNLSIKTTGRIWARKQKHRKLFRRLEYNKMTVACQKSRKPLHIIVSGWLQFHAESLCNHLSLMKWIVLFACLKRVAYISIRVWNRS